MLRNQLQEIMSNLRLSFGDLLQLLHCVTAEEEAETF